MRLSQTEPAPFAFEVITRTRIYMLRANTQRDLDDWFHALTNIAALPPENATMAKAEEMLRTIMLRRAAALEENDPIAQTVRIYTYLHFFLYVYFSGSGNADLLLDSTPLIRS